MQQQQMAAQGLANMQHGHHAHTQQQLQQMQQQGNLSMAPIDEELFGKGDSLETLFADNAVVYTFPLSTLAYKT